MNWRGAMIFGAARFGVAPCCFGLIALGLVADIGGGSNVAFGQSALRQLEKQVTRQPTMAPPQQQSALQQQSGQPLTQPEPPNISELPSIEAEPGYLGVIADDQTSQGRGVTLVDVLAGGPAALGGLKIGDLITSIDGVAITGLDGMAGIMKGRVIGEEVTFVLLRAGEALRIDVTLTKRPPPEERRFANFGRIGSTQDVIGSTPGAMLPPAAAPAVVPAPPEPIVPGAASSGAIPREPLDPNPPAMPNNEVRAIPPVVVANPNGPVATAARTGLLGIRTARVTPELQLAMNLPEPRGALVIEVRPDSPAKAVGIPVDAVIVAVDAQRINDPNDLAEIVRERGPGAEVRLSYYRYGQLYERRVKLVAPPAETSVEVAEPLVITSPMPAVGPAIGVPTDNPPPANPPAVKPVAPAPMPKSVADEAELRRKLADLERQAAEIKRQLEASPAPTGDKK